MRKLHAKKVKDGSISQSKLRDDASSQRYHLLKICLYEEHLSNAKYFVLLALNVVY